MESLLNVSPGLMIWTGIVFAILLVILSKFAFPAIISSLKEREDGITNAIANAEKANADAMKALEEAQAKLANAQSDVSEAIAQGKKQAESIITKATEEAERVKTQKVEEAKKEIERSRNEAIASIRSEVADLVIMATEKVLNEKLDAEGHKKLVENYIEQLPSN